MTPLEINGCQVAFGADGFARLETFLCENREEFSRIVVLCDTAIPYRSTSAEG